MEKLIMNGPSKITLFSDSIGKGVYFSDTLDIKRLNKNVCEIIKEKNNIDIINNSVFGQTLKRVYDKQMIDSYIDTLDRSVNNTCIIWLGANDSDYDWESVSSTPDSYHTSKTKINDFEDMLTSIIYKLKSSNVNVVLVTMLPIDSNRYFNNVLSKKYNKDNIYKFLKGDLNNLYRHQELFNNSIIKISYQTNVTLIDLRSVFLKENDFQSLLSNDGIHPNEKAQEFIYNYLFLYNTAYPNTFNLKSVLC